MTLEPRGRTSLCKASTRVWWCMGWKDSITSERAKNFEYLTNSKSKRSPQSANQDLENRCPKSCRHAKVRIIGGNFPKALSKGPSNHHCARHHSSTQYCHGIAAHADVGNARALPRCSDVHV